MARCPNCNARVSWDAAECVACNASFADAAAWKVEPENWEERQQLEQRAAARAAAPTEPAPPPGTGGPGPDVVLGFSLVAGLFLFAGFAAARDAHSAFHVVMFYGAALACIGLLRLGLKSYKYGAAFVLLGAVFGGAGFAGTQETRPSITHLYGSTFEDGVDRRGQAYRQLGTRHWNAAVCSDECRSDPHCKAWTLHRGDHWPVPRPMCSFMGGATSPKADPCCISGVKFAK